MSTTTVSSPAARPSTLWPKLHLGCTVLLGIGLLTFAGLAATGRVHFGPSAHTPPEGGEPARDKTSIQEQSRYRIEKVDQLKRLIEGSGRVGFFDLPILEAWVFKYSGGYLQCQLETVIDGEVQAGEPMPREWPSLLKRDKALAENRESAFVKEGHIILTALPSTFRSFDEAVSTYHFALTGTFAGGHQGPLHVLMPLHMDVKHRRPYRLFLSAGGSAKGEGGFDLFAEHDVTVIGPIVSRHLASEEFRFGETRDLKPGKEFVVLERQRGRTLLRLKARFLGDGEVREMAK